MTLENKAFADGYTESAVTNLRFLLIPGIGGTPKGMVNVSNELEKLGTSVIVSSDCSRRTVERTLNSKFGNVDCIVGYSAGGYEAIHELVEILQNSTINKFPKKLALVAPAIINNPAIWLRFVLHGTISHLSDENIRRYNGLNRPAREIIKHPVKTVGIAVDILKRVEQDLQFLLDHGVEVAIFGFDNDKTFTRNALLNFIKNNVPEIKCKFYPGKHGTFCANPPEELINDLYEFAIT